MIYNDDCLKKMKHFPNNTIDMVFADPPYFLSNNGLSIHSGRIVSVNKGTWDKKESHKDVKEFTNKWIKECFRILKNNGSIWISGTQHNIFDVREAILQAGFSIINIIIWHKVDPPPLIFKNKFQFSYEFIIWARKGKKTTFNYQTMFSVYNEEMHDVWNLPAVQMCEKKYGYHPTQKPECLLERIILATTNENDIVLDPFMGSGTTVVVAQKLKRRGIGIEKEREYFDIARKRLNEI